MNKILTVSCCLLGLAVACVPAYASPTRKKITLGCGGAVAPDYVIGTATVTLCASSASGLCTGETKICQFTPIPLACDSIGLKYPMSNCQMLWIGLA